MTIKPETVRRLAYALENAVAQIERRGEKHQTRDERYAVQNGRKVLADYEQEAKS